ncbi:unnamed protein product [Cylindrotheca closterium]|uniref:Uncharacterized protein n=1 Tax=Cylindrotheca closterium TaxID=2856 RepID=A0AAD2CKY7_9STRA|nr:unnamed protein product [Cylindrotheca closterium]
MTAITSISKRSESDDSGVPDAFPINSSSSSSVNDSTDDSSEKTACVPTIARDGVVKEIHKKVVRQKLNKLKHLIIEKGISPDYLDTLFPQMLSHYHPQHVKYNGGVAQIKDWKISCYLEVMEGGVPCTNPNLTLLELYRPLLDTCNDLFLEWYRQQHACNNKLLAGKTITRTCKRIMTFITRYTPAPGEQALLKHVDGAGKVDGSCVVALPIDRWSAPEEVNSFVGHGGGLTFWDGKDPQTKRPREIHYETRSGDLAFIDRAVWHQADPITRGTRWALVIFYDVDTTVE